MNKFYYNIATLTMCVEGGDTALLGDSLPGMKPFKIEALDEVDILVCTDSDINAMPIADSSQIIYNLKLEEVQYTFSVVDGVFVFEMNTKHNGDHKLTYERGSKVVKLAPCNDFFSLKFMLWKAYALVAINNGVVPIHASTVIKDNAAVLCLGESGTGKSTHTRMWMGNIAGTRMLNDDSPMLKMEEGRLRVYGSPWSGKTDFYINEDYEVKGLLRIRRASENKIQRQNTVQAIVSVYPSLPPMFANDEALADMMVDLVSGIIESTPVYIMSCLPNGDAARVACKELYGE